MEGRVRLRRLRHEGRRAERHRKPRSGGLQVSPIIFFIFKHLFILKYTQ
jgi:hypothetical protein